MDDNAPEIIPVYKYSFKDFNFTTNAWSPSSHFELSKFDQQLRKRWDNAMVNGAFRYNIDHITTRIIPGSKHYVAQLNLLRAKERRKPQDIAHINQPFNPDLFNFTWVDPKEIIFCLHNKTMTDESIAPMNPSQQSQDRHMVIINVSPMEYGHCLLVPQIDACLPQVLTETSIKVAIEMILLSKHRGFILGFNSLCAFASVNHLHFHAYYLEHELYINYCKVQQLSGQLYESTAIPVSGFVFQLHGTSVEELSRQVHKVSSFFQNSDIAHNLFINRGVQFGEERNSSNTTVRIFIWPRRKFVGTKSAEEFNVAVIELGGHLPIREEDGYYNLTEEAVDDIIAGSKLPDDHYEEIKQQVLDLFQN